jgi:protein-S-isoprenylcysteine O-methyltransferase Ste14
VVLALVVLLWQPSGAPLFALHGVTRVAMYVLCALSLGGFVWGALALMTFDPLGLAPLRAHLRDQPVPAARMVVRGPYRWVRHPLYSCAILLIWSAPDVSVDRLLFNTLWTGWIIVGSLLEERDLLREFGTAYQQYRRRVPMLVPWRSPIAATARDSGAVT